MKYHSKAVNYFDLDFEAIDKEMIADEEAEQARANEQAVVEGGCEGEGPEEVLVDPLIDPAIFILLLFWFALVFRLVLVHVLTSLFKTISLLFLL